MPTSVQYNRRAINLIARRIPPRVDRVECDWSEAPIAKLYGTPEGTYSISLPEKVTLDERR